MWYSHSAFLIASHPKSAKVTSPESENSLLVKSPPSAVYAEEHALIFDDVRCRVQNNSIISINSLLTVFLSFLFSYLSIKYFLIYLRKFSFNLIVGYRIILGLIILSLTYLLSACGLSDLEKQYYAIHQELIDDIVEIYKKEANSHIYLHP